MGSSMFINGFQEIYYLVAELIVFYYKLKTILKMIYKVIIKEILRKLNLALQLKHSMISYLSNFFISIIFINYKNEYSLCRKIYKFPLNTHEKSNSI